MSIFSRILGFHQYDEGACIKILLDRTQPLAERGAAAESLFAGQTATACAALLKVVLDETDDPQLREESAGTLGAIYNVIGVNHEVLVKIPSPYREEVLASIEPNQSRDADAKD